MKRIQRAAGVIVGSAVGNALGGPFEFGPEGALSARYPEPSAGDEMRGGGGWDPGEATDDTQMAVLVAESLLERAGLDLPDIFARFQRWAASDPKDIGLRRGSPGMAGLGRVDRRGGGGGLTGSGGSASIRL